VTDWDQRYRAGEHSPAHPHHLLVTATESLAPGRALDLACGAGRHSIYLANKGWRVTAVDNSQAGIEIACRRAHETGVMIETVLADLERGEFKIDFAAYDLICVFYYLQRDLFAGIKDGLRGEGIFVAAIHIIDDDPDSHQMNPAFLLAPGELKSFFSGWRIDHYQEGRHEGGDHKHRDAEIIACKAFVPDRPD
jgi:SAM-dependent methyltransferase